MDTECTEYSLRLLDTAVKPRYDNFGWRYDNFGWRYDNYMGRYDNIVVRYDNFEAWNDRFGGGMTILEAEAFSCHPAAHYPHCHPVV